MTEKDILIEEYRALRTEILTRIKILHNTINLGAIFWVIFILIGMLIFQYPPAIFYTFLLIIPLVFTGLAFNYQDNQRFIEATAKYLEEKTKPRFEDLYKSPVLEWEMYLVDQKKKFQFSSAFKLFSLLIPFVIPALLLIFESLTQFQVYLSLIDLFLLFVIIINFRYKLFRIK